ncbi:MAG: DUF4389 domain-containing protein [Actinomycetota bacterium]|jgi:hypothetical protein|nr:MAG: hypothetical protein FD127_220 [Acidimicrobiaceae bacterium]
MTIATASTSYPVRLEIDYPDRELNRATSALRAFTALPIMVVVCLVSWGRSSGLLTLPVGLMLLFRRKYPRWWFDWHVELKRFETRAFSYALLLDDRYPSTELEQGVHLTVDYPDAERDLNRWLPLVKWFLAIPHYLILAVLMVGVILASIGAWFVVVFTGRYPHRLFGYVVGVLRWESRVEGYAFTLVTDRYPPFRLAP